MITIEGDEAICGRVEKGRGKAIDILVVLIALEDEMGNGMWKLVERLVVEHIRFDVKMKGNWQLLLGLSDRRARRNGHLSEHSPQLSLHK